mgnify:CR=1 FL=1
MYRKYNIFSVFYRKVCRFLLQFVSTFFLRISSIAITITLNQALQNKIKWNQIFYNNLKPSKFQKHTLPTWKSPSSAHLHNPLENAEGTTPTGRNAIATELYYKKGWRAVNMRMAWHRFRVLSPQNHWKQHIAKRA